MIIRNFYKYEKYVLKILWDARDTRTKFCAKFLKYVRGGGGASKTQIVYSSNLNFHTVMPYLELLIKNGLAIRTEGSVPRYKTTAKGNAALMHFREIEILIPDLNCMSKEEDATV